MELDISDDEMSDDGDSPADGRDSERPCETMRSESPLGAVTSPSAAPLWRSPV